MKKEIAAFQKWTKRLKHWRNELAAIEPDESKSYLQQTSLERLKAAHEAMRKVQVCWTTDCGLGGSKPHQDTPLHILFTLIERGEYPPPELLLILLDGWREYLEAKGTKSLEETMICSPSQKAGIYAKRYPDAMTLHDLDFAIKVAKAPRFDPTTDKPDLPDRSQEKIAADFDKSDKGVADSLLTRLRRFNNRRKERARIRVDK